MKKAICFDFWETLYVPNPEYRSSQESLVTKMFKDLDLEDWKSARKGLKSKMDKLAEEVGDAVDAFDANVELFSGYSYSQEDIYHFLEESNKKFLLHKPLRTPLHSILAQFLLEGYIIHISSNTIFIKGDLLKEVILSDYPSYKDQFTFKFSDNEGKAKPHLSMFTYDDDVKPLVFIGDNDATDGQCFRLDIPFLQYNKRLGLSCVINGLKELGFSEFDEPEIEPKIKPKDPIEITRFSAFKFDKLENLQFDIRDYSKLKYGSKRVARDFGTELAIRFMCSSEFLSLVSYIKDKNIVVSSAPSKSIDVASGAIKDYFIAKFNPIWSESFNAVQDLKIYRGHSYNDDYGSMDEKQRDAAINSDDFHVDAQFIKDKVLFLIDDIYITGAHERRMESLIRSTGFEGIIVFIYYAEYIGKGNPNIENELNFAFIKDIKNIDYIIKNDEFIFNTRVVKYILKQNFESFSNFIDYQSDSFCSSLMKHLTGNEYHKLDEFKENYIYLKSRSQ